MWSEFKTLQIRGVQYVHCVMHKCIMVKVGGNEIYVRYVITYKFLRNQESTFCKSREKEKFPEIWGKEIVTEKKGGKFEIYGQ